MMPRISSPEKARSVVVRTLPCAARLSANAVIRHLAVFNRDIGACDLSHSKIADRLRCRLDGVACRRFPGLAADANDLRDAVDAVGHLVSSFWRLCGRGDHYHTSSVL